MKIKICLVIIFLLCSCNACSNVPEDKLVNSSESNDIDNATTIHENENNVNKENPSEDNVVAVETILANRNEWDENFSQIQFSYNDSLSEEIIERMVAHKLGVNYTCNVKDYNRKGSCYVASNTILAVTIANNWEYTALDDSVEVDRFRLYDYNDSEGYRQKIINEDIDHIVFEDNYKGEILKGITIGTSYDIVVDLYGEPDFVCSSIDLIGYVFDEFYIFIICDENIKEVSIYNRKTINDNELKTLIQFLANLKTIDLDTMETLMNSCEYSWGLSSKNFYSFEKSGFSIDVDEGEANVLEIEIYAGMRDFDISPILDNDNILINEYVKRDTIVEIEIYRHFIEKHLSGFDVDSSIYLGMAFQARDNIFKTPDEKHMIYIKGETIDDNYPCIYILSVLDNSVRKEIIVDPQHRECYWLDNNYLVYKASKGSFVYDLDNELLVPLPKEIFGNEFEINSIDNNIINFTKK